MIVLGIESTCDETGCAVVKDGREILSNLVASQINLHKRFGGVVPELACREHADLFIPLLNKALNEANVTLNQIDLIAVANGPGLIGALLVGLSAAKGLSFALKKPLIGVNHIEAHLYAAIMSAKEEIEYPCIGAVLSGGHTSLVLVKNIGEYELIGQTQDDAIGEAFDKVAKLLNLPYPGGPEVEKLAKKGNQAAFPLKSGTIKNRPFDFSFSGLKTGVLYASRKQTLTPQVREDLAASFQHTAFEDIISKTLKAAKQYQCNSVLLGGGVTNNQTLRNMFAQTDLNLMWPTKELTLDNAAMIAGLGFHRYKIEGKSDLHLEAQTRIPWSLGNL
ncbi:MAG: tRNA (adenosine(37)-N6)-threonylcarbamoyltransferase complex transferase subunit TsaD [Waddliaceae bacterium]